MPLDSKLHLLLSHNFVNWPCSLAAKYQVKQVTEISPTHSKAC